MDTILQLMNIEEDKSFSTASHGKKEVLVGW